MIIIIINLFNILMELKMESIIDYVKYYQENWRSHMNRIDAGRFPKAVLQYQPCKKIIGHLMKGWRENPRP